MRSDIRALLTAVLLFVCAAPNAAFAQALPAPWNSGDVGGPALPGSASAGSGTFTVDGSGSDIAGTADQFHFVYRPISRDGEIVARVDSLQNTNSAAKAGVMFRDTLTGNGRYAMMMITPGTGYRFQRRPATGGSTMWTTGPSGAAPGWVKVVRMGDLFVGYTSTNGTTWQGIAAETIPMGETVYVGLAVTSRDATMVARATFSNITVTGQGGNQAPAVTITQPATGTQVSAPATVAMAASATDPESRMASVGFYVEGTLISTDTTSPYSASWSASAPGTYSLTAVAQDLDGGSTTSSPVSVTVSGANQPPAVSLTAPASGATFTAPATIGLTANASDPEGQLARVEFFSGATQLGVDTAAPYAFTWSNVPAGSYSLRAVAYDGGGTSASSATVNVTVQSANSPPAVSLTSPASGASYTAPATINLTATAADSNGTVTRVEFFSGATQLGADTTSPYAFTWSNVAAGSYSLRAVAVDNVGASTSSATVTVTVTSPANAAPTVSLTGPANGATFTAPATIAIAANAADPEGQLARVDFFQGTTQLGSDSTAPYGFSWSNVPAGTYSLTARAYDAAGASATSGAVTVTVQAGTAGLPDGQVSADIGSPGTAGQTTYSSGAYTVRAGGRDIWGSADEFHFVYRPVTGDTEIVAHVASIGNTDPWAKAGIMIREALTGGSRHAMMAATPSNGAWFGRRLEPGATSVSSKDTSGPASAWVRLVRTGNLIEGFWSTNGTTWTRVGSETVAMAATVYVGLAATSHTATTATTVVYDNLVVTTPSGNQPPTVSLTSPAAGATFTAPATINLAATASDPEGQLARVEFFSGATQLGVDTTAPYSFTWSNVAAGTYSLRAVAYDTAGANAATATVSVTVQSPNGAPSVTLTSPASGATFTAPATINLTATATDPEGQIARVEFFSGTAQLGVDTTAPYAFTWSNVAAGSYGVRAVVYDSSGASASSATVTVNVSAPPSAGPTGVVFAASADHSSNVTSYSLAVFPQGADPATATPVATSDLGRPTPAANNDITVDRASFFAALPSGNYIATVSAIGPGGQTRSAPVSFVR